MTEEANAGAVGDDQTADAEEAQDAGADAPETPGADAPEAKPERPDYLPEKFWNAEEGAPRVEDLAKSYGELERGRLERTGKAPAAYKLPKAFEGFEDQLPGEQVKAIRALAKEEGYSQAGFDSLMVSLFGDPGAAKAELAKEFGDQLEPTLEAVRLFAGTLGEHEEAVRVMTSFPAGIRMLDSLRKAGAEGVLPGASAEGGTGRKTEADLRKAMQDPRYWRDRDPDYVAEVTKGWQELHGGQEQTAAINPSGRAA